MTQTTGNWRPEVKWGLWCSQRKRGRRSTCGGSSKFKMRIVVAPALVLSILAQCKSLLPLLKPSTTCYASVLQSTLFFFVSRNQVCVHLCVSMFKSVCVWSWVFVVHMCVKWCVARFLLWFLLELVNKLKECSSNDDDDGGGARSGIRVSVEEKSESL